MAITALTRHGGSLTPNARKVLNYAESMKRKVQSFREHGQKATKHVVRTAEVAGTAYAVGLIQGRMGGVEVFGLPVELLAGLGLFGFSLLGGAGEMSEHAAAIGDGALAAYAVTLGRGMGAASRSGGALPAGGAAISKGESLSPEEVAAIAERG